MRGPVLAAAAALAAALVASPALAAAQTAFSSKVQIYVDDDHTSVISPTVSAAVDVDPDTNVSAGYVADVVTSASIDIVTQASPTTIHDTRHQASLGLSRILGDWTGRFGYVYSAENDYGSHVLAGGVERRMFDKDTTFSLGYALALNTVGRADDHNFARDLTVNDVSATWTQIVTPRLATQLTYQLGIASGYQASPYRYVPVRLSVDADPMYWVPETDPDSRTRHALVIGANWFIPSDSAVQADYRYYRDTWGIVSHTIGTRLFINLTPKLELRLRNRFYTQNGASFYQASYPTTGLYMTIDRELSPLWSDTLGGKLMIALSKRFEGELKVDGFYYKYADFPSLRSRLGANLGVGVSMTY
ncbi:MAG: DUF3570 domain-containing protein [Kofleriaceae bacterium]|nr:DUF3570 domain-containing protein [Kofleriaceae bacterium]MCB9572343.1 DUF3570 domain-containing protein [Kofleriaceae bacterium]